MTKTKFESRDKTDSIHYPVSIVLTLSIDLLGIVLKIDKTSFLIGGGNCHMRSSAIWRFHRY
jgi:hypothetical protein